MRLLEGTVTIADLDAFIETLGEVADETETTIQAFDARFVVSRAHLERAVELADRAISRGNEIARDRAVEILLYASGRRQINRAFEMGVGEGERSVVILIDGDHEDEAEERLLERLDIEAGPTLGERMDEPLVRDFFDIGEEELAVVDGDLEALVVERVALLTVER
ncbi:KEOPS complex subunit Cgi121 [Haloferax namakaokahaiae]|uniref:KEOPS complex subunit Cgi121 n=1 Tax=Haloferax namakaokahaiae TaxID=1748331 RepID=A0ABD5ZJ95_9EURY